MVLHWIWWPFVRLALVLICGEVNVNSSYLFWDCTLAFHMSYLGLLDSIMRIPIRYPSTPYTTLYNTRKVPNSWYIKQSKPSIPASSPTTQHATPTHTPPSQTDTP